MKKLLAAFCLFTFYFSPAQSDSCSIRISLLTCTPGQELYSTFGHSAFRVVDSVTGDDLVFNYGTFDFYDPGFYKKFIRGKLLYYVAIDSIQNFLWEYQYYQRGVTEQALNLTCIQKQTMLAALLENARPENRYYRYDFNYDNCTTRLRDMLEKISGSPLQTKNILPSPHTTFRSLIHSYLDRGNQHWSKLGIDMLLGMPLDKKITNREAMFLPDYLMMAFDSAIINGTPLVSQKNELLPATDAFITKSTFSPLLVFCLLLGVVVIFSFIKPLRLPVLSGLLDFLLFFLCGLLGLLLLYMWFGTDHLMCRSNMNVLWALPVHLPAAFWVFSKKMWVKNYFRFIFFYSLTLLAAWFLLPQQLNIALLPVLGVIIVRSFVLSKPSAPEAQKR